jgi:hypothetical protein
MDWKDKSARAECSHGEWDRFVEARRAQDVEALVAFKHSTARRNQRWLHALVCVALKSALHDAQVQSYRAKLAVARALSDGKSLRVQMIVEKADRLNRRYKRVKALVEGES